MDKQAIVEQVARYAYTNYARSGIAQCVINERVNDILTAAGHFELVQKVQRLEKVAEAAREVVKPIKDFPELLTCRRRLKDALADLNAGGDKDE